MLGAFAVLFVVLALSMFGLYDLQLPAALQSSLSDASNRMQGGTFWGVLAMGVLSALIVGPCVAAPLAGALLYINQTRDAVLGGTGLFAMALGMGVPLLAVGASAGALMPRAGAWMQTVKNFFGVVLAGAGNLDRVADSSGRGADAPVGRAVDLSLRSTCMPSIRSRTTPPAIASCGRAWA